MKRFLLILLIIIGAQYIVPLPGFAQFGHQTPAIFFKVVSDTTTINKSVGRAYYYSTDELYYVGMGTYLAQVAIEGGSITFITVGVDTLVGTSSDSIFANDDFVFLQDVIFSGSSSNIQYYVDSDGDTVITIDPNYASGPVIIFADSSGADTVSMYHDGTKFNIIPDAGTSQIDINGTVEADSIRSEDGNFIFSPTTDKTTILTGVVNDSLRVEETALIKGALTANTHAIVNDSLRVEETALIKGALTANTHAIVNDSLRVEETALIKGALTANTHAIVNDSLRVEETALIKGALTANTHAIVNDSLRVEETSLLKGTVTTAADIAVGTKAVVNDSLRVEETSLLKGTVTTAADIAVGTKAVVNDSLRVEETSLLKGTVTTAADIAVGTKAVVNDSLRVEETSLLKGDVTLNEDLFVDDSLDVDGVLQVSPVVDSVAINGKLYVSGVASIGSVSGDSLNLRELTVTDSVFADTGLVNYLDVENIFSINKTVVDQEDPTFQISADGHSGGGTSQTTTLSLNNYASGSGAANSWWDIDLSTGAGFRFDGDLYANGSNLIIGANQYITDGESAKLNLNSDADSDGTITNETFQIAISDNSDPTLATWGFTSTQSAGYTFDKSVDITGTATLDSINTDGSALVFSPVQDSLYIIDLKVDGIGTIDAITASGTIEGATLTESSNAVPNVTDNLSVFAATTSLQLAGVISDETGSGALTFATAPSFTDSITVSKIRTGTSSMTLDVTGSGNSYVEIIQDNYAGYLAVGRTSATESSVISVTDGGADNEPGFWQMYSDGGTGYWHWTATDGTYRIGNSQPADDDAGGYAIIDADDGTIGASGQAVNGSTITGTTFTDGTASISGGDLTGLDSLNADASKLVFSPTEDSLYTSELKVDGTATIDDLNGNSGQIYGQVDYDKIDIGLDDPANMTSDTLWFWENDYQATVTFDSIFVRSTTDDQDINVIVSNRYGGGIAVVDAITASTDGTGEVYTDTQTTLTTSSITAGQIIGITKPSTASDNVKITIYYHCTKQKR